MKESEDNISPEILMEDRITSYLKGRMSKEEESAFIQELKNNPELKAKAIAMARLVKGLKEARQIKDEETMKALQSSNKEEIKEVLNETLKPKINIPVLLKQSVKWLSIAASITLIAWFGYGYYDYKKTTGLGEQFGRAFASPSIARGHGKSSKTEIKLQKLFDNVKSNIDIEYTIHELSLCWEISNMENYNDYTNYSKEIGWNLAIAYLLNNDKKNAKMTLEELKEKSADYPVIENKVTELLKEL